MIRSVHLTDHPKNDSYAFGVMNYFARGLMEYLLKAFTIKLRIIFALLALGVHSALMAQSDELIMRHPMVKNYEAAIVNECERFNGVDQQAEFDACLKKVSRQFFDRYQKYRLCEKHEMGDIYECIYRTDEEAEGKNGNRTSSPHTLKKSTENQYQENTSNNSKKSFKEPQTGRECVTQNGITKETEEHVRIIFKNICNGKFTIKIKPGNGSGTRATGIYGGSLGKPETSSIVCKINDQCESGLWSYDY